MRTTPFTLALIAGTLTAVTCSAQSTPQPQAAPMHHDGPMRADTNGDGVVTRQEAIAAADARFDRMDVNHDGKVTADEMAAMRERRANGEDGGPPPPGGFRHDRGMGRMADANGDGVLTRAEAEARAAARFDRMDANHDGKLDRTELANLAEMRHLHRGEMQDSQLPPPPPAGE